MANIHSTGSVSQGLPGCEVSKMSISQLVGQVFAAAPAPDRSRLLEQLLRPMGVLSLLTIAGGVFAKIRFHSGWQDMRVPLQDAEGVQAGDISALVDRVQQVSIDAVDGLVGIVTASPVMASSAAAALLVTVLLQNARSRRERRASMDGDPDFDPPT